MYKIKLFTVLLWVGLVIFSGLFGFILFRYTPDGLSNLIMFYFSVLGLFFCAFALLGFYTRRFFGSRELAGRYMAISLRQGLWLGIIVAGSLFLLSHKLFNGVNAIFLVLALVFLESYIISKNRTYPQE